MDVDEMGPIDFVVIELPQVPRPDVAAFRHLAALVRSGVVRILDLQLLRCREDGEVVAIDLEGADLLHGAELAGLADGCVGVLDRSDLVAAGLGLTPGSLGAVVVFENRWAAPFAVALRRSGALLVADRRVPVQAFLASLAH